MINNSNLHKAMKTKNDEFYTMIDTVEKELVHYKKHLKNKIVLCNCDDPKSSAFWKYLLFLCCIILAFKPTVFLIMVTLLLILFILTYFLITEILDIFD